MKGSAIHVSSYEDPLIRLASASVEQASQDDLEVMTYLYETPKGRRRGACVIDKIELEEFFRGDWYGMLSNIDGEMMIARLRESAKETAIREINESRKHRMKRFTE